MKNNHSTPAHTPKDLLDDLHALIAEAEKMTSTAVSDTTGDAIHALRARFDAAQERLTTLYADTKKQVVAGAHYSDEAIRTHPYQSIAVATGLGVLAGLLMGRRCGR